MQSQKRRFDFINFAYGIGAAIVISGAMAKFLDWQYADEIFVTGLGTEIVVFIISAFRYIYSRREYQWERVFPLLEEDSEADLQQLRNTSAEADAMKRNAEYVESKLKVLEDSVEKLNDVFARFTASVENLNTSVKRIEDSNKGYDEQMKELRKNLSNMNNYYDDFIEAMKYSDKKLKK